MPAAMEYTPDDKELRGSADAEFDERQRIAARNWKYYRGDHKKPLKIEDGADDNVVLNLCRPMVDRMMSFLFPDLPGMELDDLADTMPEQWLKDAWEQSGGAVLLTNMALNGAMNGQVYARVTEAENDNEFPEIINLNPANIITYWKADDYRKALWHEIRWQVGKTAYRQDIVKHENIWVIYDYKKDGSKWELSQEAEWRSPLGPIVTWPHLPKPNEFYGEHELFHAALNDVVNKVGSDANKVLRFYGSPTTIGTGFEAGKIQQTKIGGLWTIPASDAQVYNIEMQSDLSAAMKYLQLLMDLFVLQSRVTMINATPDAFRGMTNLGVRATFMDMIQKNKTLRRMYGWGIQQISQRVLMVANLPTLPYSKPPRLVWGEALPVDHREEVDLVQKQRDMKLMSARTAAKNLGLDFDTEVERQLEEVDIEGQLLDVRLNGPMS